jgi:hypothetical protein
MTATRIGFDTARTGKGTSHGHDLVCLNNNFWSKPMRVVQSLSDPESSLPPLSESPTLAWRGCDPAAGVPIGRLASGLIVGALSLALAGILLQGLDHGDVPGFAVTLMAGGCAVLGMLLLLKRTCRVCRVTPNGDGLQVLWRVADNGYTRPRFVTDRLAWSEVRRLEKVYVPEDGESGERFTVVVETQHPLQDGQSKLELEFPDELHLDAWLGEAQRRRVRRRNTHPLS